MFAVSIVRFFCVRVWFFLVLFPQFVDAKIEITDSHGKYRFASPPERVVVLNWALAEQMLELGEVPVGMADVTGYLSHTNQAQLPEGVIDVGERLSPKLSKIKELKPDVILIGYSQRSLLRPLSNIATVIYFKNFGKRYNNEEKSKSRFLEIAKLFDKSELAQAKLEKREYRLAELKSQLKQAYNNKPLPAVQFLVSDASNAAKNDASLVFGANSMPSYAAQALGLRVLGADAEKNDQFGMAQLAASQLSSMLGEYEGVFCQFNLTSYSANSSAKELPLDNTCGTPLSYQNAFGGYMSILYFAESIAHSLIVSSEKAEH